jgi:hypothetical protein
MRRGHDPVLALMTRRHPEPCSGTLLGVQRAPGHNDVTGAFVRSAAHGPFGLTCPVSVQALPHTDCH